MSTEELDVKGIEDPEAIEGPDDVSFPSYMHHFTVRAQLNKLVEAGLLSGKEADVAFEDWKEDRNS